MKTKLIIVYRRGDLNVGPPGSNVASRHSVNLRFTMIDDVLLKNIQ